MTIEEYTIESIGLEAWNNMSLKDREIAMQFAKRSRHIDNMTNVFMKHVQTFVKHNANLSIDELLLIVSRALNSIAEQYVSGIRYQHIRDESEPSTIIMSDGKRN